MKLQCRSSHTTHPSIVSVTTPSPSTNTTILQVHKTSLSIDFLQTSSDTPEPLDPIYTVIDSPSSTHTPTQVLPAVNDTSKQSASSPLNFTTFVTTAVVVFVLVSVIVMIFILLVSRHKSDRRRRNKRKKVEKKNSFVEKAGNVYSTTITESDQYEDSSEDMLCEDSFNTTEYLNNLSPSKNYSGTELSKDSYSSTEYTALNNLSQPNNYSGTDVCTAFSDIPNIPIKPNQYNAEVSTAFSDRPDIPTKPNKYKAEVSPVFSHRPNILTQPNNCSRMEDPYHRANFNVQPANCSKQQEGPVTQGPYDKDNRKMPVQHNNIPYQSNSLCQNNITTANNTLPAMHKAQNVEDYMFYPEITPISPELMHELNSRFPGSFPLDTAELQVKVPDRSSTLPMGMTTFRQAPHANVNQIKFQNDHNRDLSPDLNQQKPPKFYTNENNHNRDLEQRLYNPVHVNLYQTNPKHEDPAMSHYAQIDPNSLVRLEKPVSNNHKENLIYAELELHKK